MSGGGGLHRGCWRPAPLFKNKLTIATRFSVDGAAISYDTNASKRTKAASVATIVASSGRAAGGAVVSPVAEHVIAQAVAM